MIIVGISGIIVLVIVADNYVPGAHEVISDIPYVSSIVDTISSTINSIYSYFFNNYLGRGGGGASTPTNHLPESISRSSSGSSNSSNRTITLEDLRTDRSEPIPNIPTRPEKPIPPLDLNNDWN